MNYFFFWKSVFVKHPSQQHALLMPLRGVGFELPLLATPVEEFLVIKGLGWWRSRLSLFQENTICWHVKTLKSFAAWVKFFTIYSCKQSTDRSYDTNLGPASRWGWWHYSGWFRCANSWGGRGGVVRLSRSERGGGDRHGGGWCWSQGGRAYWGGEGFEASVSEQESEGEVINPNQTSSSKIVLLSELDYAGLSCRAQLGVLKHVYRNVTGQWLRWNTLLYMWTLIECNC